MGYRATARVFTACSRCGEKKYIAYGPMKVLNIEKETEEGKAGSITLEATYETKDEKESRTLTKEITVPYYSNFISYLDRVNEKEKPEEELKNGLVKEVSSRRTSQASQSTRAASSSSRTASFATARTD